LYELAIGVNDTLEGIQHYAALLLFEVFEMLSASPVICCGLPNVPTSYEVKFDGADSV
jgi:hypothetical protein